MISARTTTMVAVLAFAGAAVWLTAGRDGGSAGLLPYRDAGVVAEGARLYADYCASCHGSDLEGEPDWQYRRADGRLPAPPHDATGHTWHHSDAQLFFMTKYGVAALVGENYQSDMAAYEGLLDDAQIIAVLAYIKSTWPEDVRQWHDALNRRVEAEN